MANRRIHDLEDTATTLDSGAYIAVDSDSYTAAKKFAADKLPDPTGATDGYVWTADGADGAAWEAVSSGASDVTDLTTTTGSSTNMVRVAAAGGLEYRTAAQVLSDIGALAATGSVTGATSSAQTFTNGIIGPTWKPASDSTSALQLQKSTGTAVVTVDTTNSIVYAAGPVVTDNNQGYYIKLAAGSNRRVLLLDSSDNLILGSSSQTSLYVDAGSNIYWRMGGTIKLRFNTVGASFGAGNSATAFVDAAEATTSAASMRIRAGTAPTSPNAGDVWYTTATGFTFNGAGMTIDQSSATAAVPVLLLDQADDSEEMIEFTGTVGTGNAIEAVGAKTLTTTHFVKCTITGVGNVYIPVGTIA